MAFKTLKQRKIRTINPDLAKYRERFGCNDITQDHLLQARKALIWRELPNNVLDYKLSIFFGRMKFNAQLSHFTAVSRHCQKCYDRYGSLVDETFAHGSYDCPVLKKMMDQTLWVFGLGTYNNSTAKDLLVWHYYLKQESRERNHGNEAFHKLVMMCIMAHVLYKRSLNQNPTIYLAVDSVCNIIFNI